MKNKPLVEYRRNLPHIQPKDAAFFVTFRLHGSIPLAKLDAMSQQYLHDKNFTASQTNVKKVKQNAQEAYFEALDEFLDTNPNGPYYLANEQIAQIVKESLHYRDANDYALICYCLMSNHVHMIIYKLQKPLHIVMKELKGYTGKESLKILDLARTLDNERPRSLHVGSYSLSHEALRDPALRNPRPKKFWQAESFDRIIRNSNDLQQKIHYTLNNPVKAGLVAHWKDWPHLYVAPGFME